MTLPFPKMNPEIKAKWIAALRSGKYKQGRKFLRDNECFCCLGVLCDLVDPNGWTGKELSAQDLIDRGHPETSGTCKVMTFQDVGSRGTDEFVCYAYPPEYILERTGLAERAASSLAEMNDRFYPFSDIANTIEREL